MTPMTEYAARRKKMMAQLDSNSVAILIAAPVAYRNADTAYPYRQNSDFYYMTGFEEPESVAILMPHRKEGEFILFNRPHQPEREQWEGPFAGQDGARTLYGADESFPITEFKTRLPELLEGRCKIYYTLGVHQSMDHLVLQAINHLRGKIRNGVQPPPVFIDFSEIIHALRLFKSPHEIELLQTAAAISAEAHLAAMKSCQPEMNEYQLEAEIMATFQRKGARYPAYSPIVGSGENTCILHYTANNQVMQDGAMVLVDAGCEYHYYAADITRTFPVNGLFTGEQRAVYDIVLAAQEAGIAAIQPGQPWSIVQEKIVAVLTQGLVDLNILSGNVSDLIEQQAYLPYYMHKSGHWLGLDVHDVGYYKVNHTWRLFQPNMVLTVEPGLYLSAAIPGLDSRWHGIGIRIEDDILVTASGSDVLTYAVPKMVEEIEGLMRR